MRDPENIKTFTSPAYSIAVRQSDMTVAVSPVRQTLQIGGSLPTILGAGISAVQDGISARKIRQVLGDYDCTAFFREQVEKNIQQRLGGSFAPVAPLGTTAGFHNIKEARAARFGGLRKAGHDAVLDLELVYGIYGAEGLMATRIKGELSDLSSGKVLWRNTITAYSIELFEGMRWRDPMERMSPNLMSPRLAASRDAIEQWTRDDGSGLRQAFESSTGVSIEGMFCDLGVSETPEGLMALGSQALLSGKSRESVPLFRRAHALAPERPEIANGLALSLARTDSLEEAVSVAEKAVAAAPDCLPLRYNLAWWYGVNMKNPDLGRSHYDKALELGAHPARRLERAFRNK